MTDLLDTSILVRYLTLEPPHLGARAQELVDGGDPLSILSVALVETAFVLTRLYGVDRAQAVDLLIGLLSRHNIAVLDVPKALAMEALRLCRPSHRVSFADAMIWASARAAVDGTVCTFDRRFPAAGIRLRLLNP